MCLFLRPFSLWYTSWLAWHSVSSPVSLLPGFLTCSSISFYKGIMLGGSLLSEKNVDPFLCQNSIISSPGMSFCFPCRRLSRHNSETVYTIKPSWIIQPEAVAPLNSIFLKMWYENHSRINRLFTKSVDSGPLSDFLILWS